jgi:hypothetical protein
MHALPALEVQSKISAGNVRAQLRGRLRRCHRRHADRAVGGKIDTFGGTLSVVGRQADRPCRDYRPANFVTPSERNGKHVNRLELCVV